MGLAEAPSLLLTKLLGGYLELLNSARVRRGRPRLEPRRGALYVLGVLAAPAAALLAALYIASILLRCPLPLHLVVPAVALALPLVPLAVEYLSYLSYVRSLKEDLAYFMVLEGVSPGDDLLRDLEEESGPLCSFLPALCNECSRLRLFTRFFPGMRGIREYVARAPRPMRRLLLEYVVVRETAELGSWLYSKFQEALRELRTSARSSLELRTLLSLSAVVFSGLSPPLVALASALSGAEVPHAYLIVAAPAAALAAVEGLAPRLLKVPARIGELRYLAPLLAAPPLLLPLLGARASASLLGLLLTALGAAVTARYVRAYSAIVSLPSRLVGLADRIPYSSNPRRLVEESLADVRGLGVLPSLCYHMLLRSLKQGGIDTVRVIAFKDVVEELFSLVRQGTIVRALVLATALSQPFILSFSASLAAALGLGGDGMMVFSLASSLFYGAAATFAVFGTLGNTLVVGLVLLELCALGVVP